MAVACAGVMSDANYINEIIFQLILENESKYGSILPTIRLANKISALLIDRNSETERTLGVNVCFISSDITKQTSLIHLNRFTGVSHSNFVASGNVRTTYTYNLFELLTCRTAWDKNVKIYEKRSKFS